VNSLFTHYYHPTCITLPILDQHGPALSSDLDIPVPPSRHFTFALTYFFLWLDDSRIATGSASGNTYKHGVPLFFTSSSSSSSWDNPQHCLCSCMRGLLGGAVCFCNGVDAGFFALQGRNTNQYVWM
jgi:hypothetical protein